MRFYTSPFSSNARRAHMTLIHLGISHEDIVVDLAKRDQKAPSFLAMNPNGRVPVLVDDDLVLTESHAIMAYVADVAGAEEVWPRAPKERADVHRWLFWSAHHMTPAVSVLNWENMVKKMIGIGPADPKEVARGEALFREFAAVLDGHLAKHEWLAHDRLTLADLAVSTPFMSRIPAKLPLDGFGNIERWHARMRELDCWKKTDL
jgi:glutathione S-transferase